MNESEKLAYIQGKRMAWAAMLDECIKNLGYDSDESKRAGWIVEREQAIIALRRLCAEHGDNDWPDNLDLADILEKHLEAHLAEPDA